MFLGQQCYLLTLNLLHLDRRHFQEVSVLFLKSADPLPDKLQIPLKQKSETKGFLFKNKWLHDNEWVHEAIDSFLLLTFPVRQLEL